MIVSRQGRKLHVFEPQDLVYCRDFKSAKPSRCPAKVVSKTGPLSYQVHMRDGRITKRHVDHLMQRSAISEVDKQMMRYWFHHHHWGKMLNGFLRMFHPKGLGARGSHKDVQLGPDNPQIAMFLLGEGEDVTLNQGWGKALSNSLSLKHKLLNFFKHKHKHKHYPGIHDLS